MVLGNFVNQMKKVELPLVANHSIFSLPFRILIQVPVSKEAVVAVVPIQATVVALLGQQVPVVVIPAAIKVVMVPVSQFR